MRARTFIFLLCITTLNGYSQIAQTDTSNIIYNLSGKILYSSIWTGRESLHQFTQDHPWSAQIDFSVLKNTQYAWNYCHCYSQSGLSFGYINFANPSKLGKAFTVAGFAEPYLLLSKRFQISLRGGMGLAFLNKVYDSIANRENIFFSTKMSFLLMLGTNFSWQINEYLKFKTSIQFNHISNGGRRDPNEGMNFPGFTIGLDYSINRQKLERRTKEKFTGKSVGVVIHTFGNLRTAWAGGVWPEERQLVLGSNGGVIKRISRLNGVGAGGEFYYDGINSVYQQRSGQSIQTVVAAVNVQHYLFFGKLLFGQQLAWFVTPNTGYKRVLFQRYFIEYEMRRNWYAGFSLKAHGDHADYLAFSTGYFFKI